MLKAYVEWGAACVEQMNGIFAFSVYEPFKQRLCLTRDRLGVKLFISTREALFVFRQRERGDVSRHSPVANRKDRLGADFNGIRQKTLGCGVFQVIYELPAAAYRGYLTPHGLVLQRY